MPDQEFSKDTSSRTWKDWIRGAARPAGRTEMGAYTFTVQIQGISRRMGLLPCGGAGFADGSDAAYHQRLC